MLSTFFVFLAQKYFSTCMLTHYLNILMKIRNFHFMKLIFSYSVSFLSSIFCFDEGRKRNFIEKVVDSTMLYAKLEKLSQHSIARLAKHIPTTIYKLFLTESCSFTTMFARPACSGFLHTSSNNIMQSF